MAKRARKIVKPKYDWEALKLFLGMGSVMTALGIFFIWVSYTAPEGVVGSSTQSFTKQLIRMIPSEILNKIGIGIGVLFVLFGVFLILNIFYRTIKFIITSQKYR
jgi:hypothetical protein